jgi:hypothetical protein
LTPELETALQQDADVPDLQLGIEVELLFAVVVLLVCRVVQ